MPIRSVWARRASSTWPTPDPGISNDGPTFYPINSRSPITWTATDGSGNASQADQLITIKEAGSNTPPVVILTGSSEGAACTISPDARSIACDVGDLAAGEQRTVTLSFDSEPGLLDPGLLDDKQVDIALSVTTSSEAINQVTEAFVVRNLSGERIFRDRFIQP